jgi:hypothetical protein
LWTFIARQLSSAIDEDVEAQSKAADVKSEGKAQAPASPSIAAQSGAGLASLVLSKEEKDLFQAVFKLFDTDGEGKLEERELASAIYAMGFSTRDHRQMAKALIGKYNGSLTLPQFTELMGSQLAGRDPEEEIRATFALMCGEDPSVTAVNLQVLLQGSPGESVLGTRKIRLASDL